MYSCLLPVPAGTPGSVRWAGSNPVLFLGALSSNSFYKPQSQEHEKGERLAALLVDVYQLKGANNV